MTKHRNTQDKALKLYWWRYDYPSKLNFGDEVTTYIIERIFGNVVEHAEINDAQMIGAGSILEYCDEVHGGSERKIAVWGSGFIQGDSVLKYDSYDFYAIRGRLSAARITDRSVAVGDPGIMMSYAYPEYYSAVKRYDVGIIPHYVDAKNQAVERLRGEKNVLIINPLDTPLEVARQINQCRIIFSSSLHGLIFADSYSVPNYWTPLSNDLTGGAYKFNDYYSVYGERARENDLLASFQDWRVLEGSFVSKNLGPIQERLIKAFPFKPKDPSNNTN